MRLEVKALLGKVLGGVFWEADRNRMRTGAKAFLGKVGSQWLLCWAPMWEHYGRKD